MVRKLVFIFIPFDSFISLKILLVLWLYVKLLQISKNNILVALLDSLYIYVYKKKTVFSFNMMYFPPPQQNHNKYHLYKTL